MPDSKTDFGILKMKVSHQFCIILATDNNLYSMGKSKFGALGIRKLTDSQKVANRIILPEPVINFQVGEKHVLALTRSGRLYAWGSNEFGQTGTGESQMFYDTPQPVLSTNNLKALPEKDR